MEATEDTRFIYQFGQFVLDPQEKTLFLKGKPLHLPAKEFETLRLLVENSGRALRKEEIIAAVWHQSFVEEGNLTKQISRLRKLLGGSESIQIETLPKHGYRFSAEVNRFSHDSSKPVIENYPFHSLPVKSGVPAEKNSQRILSGKSEFASSAPVILLCFVILLGVLAGVIWLGEGTTRAVPAKIDSIAVLPLRSLPGEKSRQALDLGLTDNLVMKIGGLRQIVVRPISAVIPYTDTAQDSLEIGRKLKVDAVLEGTVQHFERRVRLNARLLRVENGEQLWAEQFEGNAEQIFDLQDYLTTQIVQALKLKLSLGEKEKITKRFTNNPEALDAFQKGRYFSSRRTAGDLRAAIEYYNQAIFKDPKYALAYAGLADAYSLLADYDGALPRETYPKAKEAALKAIELDPELAEAQTSLAYVKMFFYHDWEGAQEGYRLAISLNPNYATAHHWYSEYLTAMGRFDEAFVEIRRAKEIDPLSPSINAQEMWIFFYSRRYDDALERGYRIAEMNPDYAEIYDPLKRCYDRKGMYREAIEARQKRRQLAGWDVTETTALRDAAAAPDSAVYWKKRLEQEIIEAQKELPMPFEMALIYANLGEKEMAFEWLDKAIESHSYPIIFLKVTPDIDPLRSDPRFADALRRVDLLD